MKSGKFYNNLNRKIFSWGHYTKMFKSARLKKVRTSPVNVNDGWMKHGEMVGYKILKCF
jgi:hypothetical protein